MGRKSKGNFKANLVALLCAVVATAVGLCWYVVGFRRAAAEAEKDLLTLQEELDMAEKALAENPTATDKILSKYGAEKTGEAWMDYKYVAGKNADIFHKLDCPDEEALPVAGRTYYTTRADAMEDGKTPCAVCDS